jgi:two-component system, sporulation sensor kinase E
LGDVRLIDIASETLDFFSEEFAKHRIVAERDWSDRIPAFVGDPARMRQVFQNLVQNAVHSMPEGGKIRIAIQRIDGTVQVELIDTGHGIPPEQIPTLFKPFSSTKRGGTGLGLMISKKIVQEHSGTIRVDSKLGEGTKFTIQIPVT